MGKVVIWVSISALALGLLWAGCGGSSDTSSTPDAQSSIPLKEYAKRAAANCKKAEAEKYKQIGAAFKLASVNGKLKMTKASLEKLTETVVVPRLRDLAEGLRNLPPAAEGQEQIDKAVDLLEEQIDKVEEDPKLFIESAAFTETNAAMRKAKIVGCVINQ